MRVLLIIRGTPAQRILIKLHTEELIDEIKSLISKRRNSKAITTALSKGIFEKDIKEDEMRNVDVNLILSEHSASWDLSNRNSI